MQAVTSSFSLRFLDLFPIASLLRMLVSTASTDAPSKTKKSEGRCCGDCASYAAIPGSLETDFNAMGALGQRK
jgi:hypothetical protein